MLSKKQRQRNLENISYVRSLLKQKQEQNHESQTRTEHSNVESTETEDPGT